MPTYGYECAQCGNSFEIIQRITDNALDTCENCGGELKKKIFPVGIVFKGSGFYVNDYARKGEGKSATAATSEEPAKVDTAAESKPADVKAEANTADSKPAETKPTESKPAETKAAPSAG